MGIIFFISLNTLGNSDMGGIISLEMHDFLNMYWIMASEGYYVNGYRMEVGMIYVISACKVNCLLCEMGNKGVVGQWQKENIPVSVPSFSNSNQ